MAREKLNPAGGPRIEPISVSPGEDVKFAAVFEVLPEVKLKPLTDLVVDKPVASVADEDLDAMLDTLRKQRPVFNDVSRGAATNDRVTVDFTGAIDGAEFDGGSGNEVAIVIGSGRVMKEFEDALLGTGPATRVNSRRLSPLITQSEARRQAGDLQREDWQGRRAAARAAR